MADEKKEKKGILGKVADALTDRDEKEALQAAEKRAKEAEAKVKAMKDEKQQEAAAEHIRKIREHKEKREAIESKTNQDMINILYKAAKELDMAEWTLIQKVGLEKLTDARTAPYSGPAVKDFPGIPDDQKAVIQKVLENYKRPE